MKQKFFTIAPALFLGCGFLGAQIQPSTPKNSRYIPMGSFEMEYILGQDTSHKIVSVQSFYMSSEVSNREYREYVDYLKAHSADTLYYFDIRKIVQARVSKKQTKDSARKQCQSDKWMDCAKPDYVVFKTHIELLKDIIDTSVWKGVFANNKKLQQKYDHYFSDKAFNDYPVVGVSYENARWFCIWKSKMDYEQRIREGKFIENDFRLPTEAEWAYVASQGNSNSAKDGNIHSAKEGEKNDFKIKNLSGNVAEWTLSNDEGKFYLDPDYVYKSGVTEKGVARGGSWKTRLSTEERKVCNKNERNCFTGFRMVKTYTGNPAQKT